MTELQEFTAAILERKEKALAQEFETLKGQEEARLTAALEQLAQQQATEKAKLDAAFDLERSTALQRIDNGKRNAVLAERQTQLLSVFDKAYEAMAAWDKETFSGFLNQVLGHLDQEKTYLLTLGEKSQHTLELPNHVTLVDTVIPNEAGFVLETEGIRYNYLFRALLDDMAPELLGRLSQQLES